MAAGSVFPITGWVNDLSQLPAVKDDEVYRFFKSRSDSERQFDRSYNFLVEGFVVAASIKANYARKR